MQGPPAFRKLLDTINEAVERLKREETVGQGPLGSARKGWLLLAEPPHKPIVIVGDLHGDAESLEWVLKAAGDDSILVFLGDYVDRGPPEGQVHVLHRVLELYMEGRAILLRGNHEPPENLIPHPHDYPTALVRLYGDEHAAEIYSASMRLFQKLPAVLVMRGLFLAVHGGPPTIGLDRDLTGYLWSGGDPVVLEELLWNDPEEMDIPRKPNPRGAGSLWGRPVTRAAIEKAGVEIIVRGHEPAYAGYKWNHDGRVLTIFSRIGPPYMNPGRAIAKIDSCRLTPGAEECLIT
ncbi:MAG: serine/threonine protein phosphatase, partial [Desulfurococcales archaeon]|nr:serine/threonine protein phosphatase [Desulfurococcales archaeon]